VLLRANKLEIHRGERVALLGPNGSGKTTLLRTMVGELKPLQGQPRLGHNVAIGYYAQGHDKLNMQATVLDELWRASPKMNETQARTLLGRFLFSGDDVFKRVGDLSGGERSRVALAQLTLLPGNLLVLDEPTNHLDIQAREALEGVLKEYPGSILFVSHDRYFIDAVADKLWVVEGDGLREFFGNYSEYMAYLADRGRETGDRSQADRGRETGDRRPETGNGRPPSADNNGTVAVSPSANDKQRKKKLAALENEVALLEKELAQLNNDIQAASAAQDVGKITRLGQQYSQLESLLQQRYADWEELAA
jgi:ATP-binding cassette subfamily F protein 3